jgi:type I restriction enzyme S subunit
MSKDFSFVEFGEIAEFRNGMNFSKDSHGKGCWLIGVSDFQKHFTPDYDTLEEINPEGITKKDDYLKKGDIIFVRSNGNKALVGRSLYIDRDVNALFSGFCIRARLVSDIIDSLFLAYYTRTEHFKSSISSVAGTNINNLNQDILSNVKLPLYPKNVQSSITNVLSALDAKIELNQRINAELESMAKTLYDYWFVQFDFPNEKGKPYKSAGGKMVWNEALKREIPLGWEVGTLLDIADYMNGLPCQKFRPTGNESLRVIKIREMHEGFSENSELTRPDIPQKSIIENGDVLFSWSASLEVQIWTGGKGALNQHIFKVTSDKYPKSFYYYQLINYLTHFKMMAENRKTTMGHITQEHLQQSRIALPPKELTLKLEKIISPIFEKKMVNEIESQTLTGLRDWLLPMLMNGQVKVG